MDLQSPGIAMSTRPALRLARLLPLLPVLLGLACGGGGGSGSAPSFTLHFTPDRLTAQYFHNQHYLVNTYAAPATASVSGTIDPLPSGTLYVVLAFDAAVFVGNPSLNLLGGNAFSLSLTPDATLAPGAYTGNITIQLFQDAALTKPYSVTGGTLPYTLTVDPELTVTATIDGVVAGVVFSSSSTAVTDINGSTIYWNPSQPAAAFTLTPGQVLELQASVPVTWHSPDQFYPYGYLWQAPTITATTLTQTIAAPPDGIPGMTGNAYIAVPSAGGQFGAGLIVDIQR
jgi:hypothetical protein